MADPQTIFGQAHALAREIAGGLNDASDDFCLPVSAVVVFHRKLSVEDIPSIGSAVLIHVIPRHEASERDGLGGIYNDIYGVRMLIYQNVTDSTGSGGLSESQLSLLLKLRSEIVELLLGTAVDADTAQHAFYGAHVLTAAAPTDTGLYDLDFLEEHNVFRSELILTYRAAGLRRSGA